MKYAVILALITLLTAVLGYGIIIYFYGWKLAFAIALIHTSINTENQLKNVKEALEYVTYYINKDETST